MTSAVEQVLRANVILAAAVLLVLILRKPVRAGFGARIAYALWFLPPLAALACFLPPRIVEILLDPLPTMMGPAPVEAFDWRGTPTSALAATPFDWSTLILPLWLTGAVGMALWFASSQWRFMKDARTGKAGPAVVGFLRPRIITPSDFETRFDQREQDVILTHESIHLRRGDAHVNALVALTRCLCWFNPLVHIAAHCLRIDQELACDATVVERRPNARRLYADALLKAQLAARPLPLGCYWPAGTEHPLTERIAMLKKPSPKLGRRLAGLGVVIALALSGGAGTWAMLPPQMRYVEAPIPAEDVLPPAPVALQALPASPKPAEPAPMTDATPVLPIRIAAAPAPPAPAPAAGGPEPPEPGKDGKTDGDWTFTIHADQSEVDLATGRTSYHGNVSAMFAGLILRGDELTVEDPTRTGFTSRIPKGLTPLIMADSVTPGADAFVYEGRVEAMVSDKVLIRGQRLTVKGMAPLLKQRSVALPDSFNATFDASDPILLRGRVTKVESDDKNTFVWMQAINLSDKDGTNRPNSQLWRVQGPGKGKMPAWVSESAVMGKEITVRGYRALDKGCTPACLVSGRDVTLGRSGVSPTAAPDVPSPAAEPSWQQSTLKPLPPELQGPPAFAALFDADAPILLNGKVTNIDAINNMPFVWVTRTDDGQLFRVMLGKSTMGADWLNDNLLGKDVTVRGYRAKDKSCASGCLINGRDITIGDEKRLIGPGPPPLPPGAQRSPPTKPPQ